MLQRAAAAAAVRWCARANLTATVARGMVTSAVSKRTFFPPLFKELHGASAYILTVHAVPPIPPTPETNP